MAVNANSMTAEDRAKLVLEYMARYPVAMSPGLWHANLELDQSVTFSNDTTRRRIQDFYELDWVERHDIDQGVYRISDAGRSVVEDGVDPDDLTDVIGIAQDE